MCLQNLHPFLSVDKVHSWHLCLLSEKHYMTMEELQVVSPSDGEEKTLVDGLPRDRRNTHMGRTLLEVRKSNKYLYSPS